PKVSLANRLGVDVRSIQAERRSRPIRVPREVSPDVAEFLGLQLSEGMIKGGKVVEFYNNDQQLRSRYRRLVKRIFGLEAVARHQQGTRGSDLLPRVGITKGSCQTVPFIRR